MIEFLAGALAGWVAMTKDGREFADNVVKKTTQVAGKVGKQFLVSNNLWIDEEKPEPEKSSKEKSE